MSPHYTIILIDDEPTVATYVRALIVENAGRSITLDSAGTLNAGIAMCKTSKRPYNLIILDLDLPDAKDLHGLETILHRLPETPVIVLTGNYDRAQAERALEMGAQYVFQKGIDDGEELYQQITEAILRNRRIIEYQHQLVQLRDDLAEVKQEAAEAKEVATILREDLAKANATIETLRTTAKNRKEDVDKRIKKLNWSTIGVAVLAVLSNDKVVEFIGKLLAALF